MRLNHHHIAALLSSVAACVSTSSSISPCTLTKTIFSICCPPHLPATPPLPPWRHVPYLPSHGHFVVLCGCLQLLIFLHGRVCLNHHHIVAWLSSIATYASFSSFMSACALTTTESPLCCPPQLLVSPPLPTWPPLLSSSLSPPQQPLVDGPVVATSLYIITTRCSYKISQ